MQDSTDSTECFLVVAREFVAAVDVATYKVLATLNLLDIRRVESKSTDELVFSSANGSGSFTFELANVDTVVSHVWGALVRAFPNALADFLPTFHLHPLSRLDAVKLSLPALDLGLGAACGGFATAYAVICHHRGVPADESIPRHFELLQVNSIVDFDFGELPNVDKRVDAAALAQCLEYNRVRSGTGFFGG